MGRYKKIITELLEHAGVTINGSNPYDIQVKNEGFYQRVLLQGSVGLGESYMDGWWECQQLDEFFCKVLRAKLDRKVNVNFNNAYAFLIAKLFNLQSKKKSKEVISRHYDLDINLFMSFLDRQNQYSCGYFKNTDDLNKAQEQKLDLICRKLHLSSNDKVLDIGCGWGGFARFAAENYGCHVTGINISDEQINYAREYCKGFPVNIIKCDYRDIKGSFDKIASIEIMEHIGYKNYNNFMKIISNCLKENGVFIVQTSGSNVSKIHGNTWTDKYTFPNFMLPSMKQISDAIENIFIIEDLHVLTTDYDKTLMLWHTNFNRNWSALQNKYDAIFKKMWEYYLLSCAGAFRAKDIQAWQFVMTKQGSIVSDYRIP